MRKLFKSYLVCFSHPIQSLSLYFDNIPVKGHEGEDLKIKMSDSILCSWVFHILKALSSIIFYYFLAKSISSYIPDDLMQLKKTIPNEFLTPNVFFVLTLTQDMILFPLVALFSIKISILFIRFFSYLLGMDFKESEVDKVFTIALSTHVLSLVPVIGTPFQKIFYLSYYFMGLKKLLKCSSWIAVIIIISPYFFLGLFISFIVGFMFLLIG